MVKRRFTVKSQVEKARRKRRAFLISMIVLLIVLVGVIIWGLNNPRIQIDEIEVENDTSINDFVFRSLAENRIDGKYFFIIPRSSSFVFPKNKLERRIERISPEIESVSIKIKDFKKMVIKVENRVPYSIWCSEDKDSFGECYFADKEALIFKKSPEFSYQPFAVFSAKFKKDPLGKKYISQTEYNKLLWFYDFLKDNDLEPSVLAIRSDSIAVELKNGAVMIIETDDIERTAENVLALVSSNEMGRGGFDFSQAEYVDLRYGNKVFWKPEGQ